jgi:GT-D fold-like domain
LLENITEFGFVLPKSHWTGLYSCRVGDGEGNVIALGEAPKEPTALKIFNRIFDIMNGVTLDDSEARVFSRRLSVAIFNADFLGFRSLDRSFMMTETDILTEADNLQNTFKRGEIRGLLGMLYAREFLDKYARAGYFSKSKLTSAWVHLGLIKDLEEILEEATAVIVITGTEILANEFRRRLGKRLRFIAIPPEGSRIESSASHYQFHFPRILESLHDLSGVLVLVGGGIFGKIYCDVAKQAGGVAVDLGSAFDVPSRP